MKRKILLIAFLVLAALLSVSAISANDVNVTDSYATNLVDDSSDDSVLTSYEIDSSEVSASNDGNPVSNIVDDSSKVSLSSEEVLGSDDSNNLSTNNLGSSLDSDILGATSTKIVANNLNTYYTSGDKLKVSLVDGNGKGISGQKVIIHIVGKDYTRTTDANGNAYLPIGLNPGTYSVTVSFKGTSQYSAAKDVSVAVNVLSTIKSNDLVKYYNGRAKYEVTLVNSHGAPLAGKVVTVTIASKSYHIKTNTKGVASLAIGLKPGSYKITAQDPNNGLKVTNTVNVLPTVAAKDLGKPYAENKKFTATFYTSEGKKLVGAAVQFVFTSGKSSKTYHAKTNADGVASLAIGAAPGSYTMKSVNTADGTSCTNNINVYIKVSMSSIISGSKAVKSYYAAHDKLPTSVNLKEGTITMPQFLYLMSKAIVQLGNSNTNPIKVYGVDNAASSTPDRISSQQLSKSDYITLAKRVASYIENNKKAPAYASSSVGNIVYEELGDAFSRIIAFYSDNNKYLPNYVTITQGSYTPGPYPSTISALAKQLTSGLTSERAKAVALYNWVRDYISYEFYYDTQKGASGTLSSRGGNCCDQAQLLVALARSSGLTARFATGYCKFSSGNSYGHVWVQIKLSGSWHAVDTTSTRNSFDSIVNWNTASYTNRGTYDVLPY